MKTIFDKAMRSELINRVHSLDENSEALWGKMDVRQMLRHCTIWNDWVLGRDKFGDDFKYRQEFLGLIFGKMALKGMVKDDRPIKKNMPAGQFVIKDKGGDVDLHKKIWIEQIAAYEHYSNPAFVHDFFGRMTVDQIGIFAFKHMDHHLRQFSK
jgi:hypothetical protein